jgi:uncharacterized OB-fold protein
VSGQGSVYTYTISVYQWHPAFPTPYVIAAVALLEQPSVRLTTNITACAPENVYVGMPVQVHFLRYGDIFLPVFEPVPDGGLAAQAVGNGTYGQDNR